MTANGETLAVTAPAKINLYLAVLGKRPDGFHELLTVFQSLALADRLTVQPGTAPGVVVRCDDERLPESENLCTRAAHLLAAAAGHAPDDLPAVELQLEKRIPLGAGLGGGSSDAAATLRALNAWWGLGVGDADLLRLAGALGADVPYFLSLGTALATGRGDVIEPLEPLPPLWVVLAMPEEPVSTADAFAWWDEQQGVSQPGAAGHDHFRTFQDFRARQMLRLLRAGALDGAAECCINDLEVPVTHYRPDIAVLIRQLRAAGCPLVRMTGAGAAVFGIAETEADARAIAARIDAPWVTVTHTGAPDG